MGSRHELRVLSPRGDKLATQSRSHAPVASRSRFPYELPGMHGNSPESTRSIPSPGLSSHPSWVAPNRCAIPGCREIVVERTC